MSPSVMFTRAAISRCGLFVLLCWLLVNLADAAPDDDRLLGRWMPLETQQAEPSLSRLGQPFVASRPSMIRRGSAGALIELQPENGRWPDPPWVLAIHDPAFTPYQLELPNGHTHGPQRISDPGLDARLSRTALGFIVDEALEPGSVIHLQLLPDPSMAVGQWFELSSLTDYLPRERERFAIETAVFTTLLATAAVALLFGWVLRDLAYLYYLGYLLSYGVLQLLTLGYAFHEFLPQIWGTQPLIATRVSAGLSVAAVALFADRFCDLDRHAPFAARLLRATAGLFVVLAVLPMLGTAARDFGAMFLNPMVFASGPVLLGCVGFAALRGSRYAVFFLIGWLPLVSLSVMNVAHAFGWFADWRWLSTAALCAAAYQAVVLSLGLADRALAIRDERDRARQMAEIDGLTGLQNRRSLMDQFAALLATRRRNQPLSLLFIDLDHFKALNDRAGHIAGDNGLVRMAAMMRARARPGDLTARLGGEEFVMVLPGRGLDEACRFAEQLRLAVASQGIAAAEDVHPFTVSIGVAEWRHGETPAALLERADQALYSAKAAGRNRVAREQADVAAPGAHRPAAL